MADAKTMGKLVGMMFTALLDTKHQLGALIDVLEERDLLNREILQEATERHEASLESYIRSEALVDPDFAVFLEELERRKAKPNEEGL
jgi:hypothetical protein